MLCSMCQHGIDLKKCCPHLNCPHIQCEECSKEKKRNKPMPKEGENKPCAKKPNGQKCGLSRNN